jgi:hypothetical protein
VPATPPTPVLDAQKLLFALVDVFGLNAVLDWLAANERIAA